MTADFRRTLAALRHPPFVTCVVILVVAAVCTGPVADWMDIVLRKDPAPLRKPLPELNKDALGEYRWPVGGAHTIDAALLASLGTEEYIDWEFIDTTEAGAGNPLRRVRAFVTYYTGKPDLVPHTPDVCYRGSGYEITKTGNPTLELQDAESEPLSVPARAVTFVKSSVKYNEEFTVVYTIHCNGKFVNTRTDVRWRLANPAHKGAYYCKVEVSFGREGSKHRRNAGREETIQAAEKFLARFLPVLLRDHLPDWEAVQKGQVRQN